MVECFLCKLEDLNSIPSMGEKIETWYYMLATSMLKMQRQEDSWGSLLSLSSLTSNLRSQ